MQTLAIQLALNGAAVLLVSLLAGLLADAPFSPLEWATRIAEGEYRP